MSKGLDYFGIDVPDERAGIDGEGFRSRRALMGMLFSLGATCGAIALALLEPAPVVRRFGLVLVALAGIAGLASALLALRRRVSQADRTLIACGILLGGLSLGAAAVLFS